MVLAEVDNLIDEIVARFGPLGKVEHVSRNLFHKERISVLQQPSAVDSFAFSSTEGRYPVHELIMDGHDTARTEPTELEFVSTVRVGPNKDEVADGEGRSDYVGSLVVLGDGALGGEDSRHAERLCGFHTRSSAAVARETRCAWEGFLS